MSISKPHLASQCYSRWYSWDCRSYQRSINLNGEADCNDSAKHCGNKVKVNKVWINKKDMGVQACIMPNSVFLAQSCRLQLPYFCSKVLLSVSQKTKQNKKASFCALMDLWVFWCKCIWNQRRVLVLLLVMQLFFKPQKKRVVGKKNK